MVYSNRVLLKIKLSMMSPFSWFFFFFRGSAFVSLLCQQGGRFFRFAWRVAFCALIFLVCATTSCKPESSDGNSSTVSRATPAHWQLWPGGGRSVRAGLSTPKYITEYREQPFADLGL